MSGLYQFAGNVNVTNTLTAASANITNLTITNTTVDSLTTDTIQATSGTAAVSLYTSSGNIQFGTGAPNIIIGSATSNVFLPGTVTTVNTTNLNVSNNVIVLNDGDVAGSGFNSGIWVEEGTVQNSGYIVVNSDRTGWNIQAPNNPAPTVGTNSNIFLSTNANVASTLVSEIQAPSATIGTVTATSGVTTSSLTSGSTAVPIQIGSEVNITVAAGAASLRFGDNNSNGRASLTSGTDFVGLRNADNSRSITIPQPGSTAGNRIIATAGLTIEGSIEPQGGIVPNRRTANFGGSTLKKYVFQNDMTSNSFTFTIIGGTIIKLDGIYHEANTNNPRYPLGFGPTVGFTITITPLGSDNEVNIQAGASLDLLYIVCDYI